MSGSRGDVSVDLVRQMRTTHQPNKGPTMKSSIRTLASRYSRPRWRPNLEVRRLEERAVPANFVVTNTADSGAGSLRTAILLAEFSVTPDTITFEPSYFNVPRTINLTSGEFAIEYPLSII